MSTPFSIRFRTALPLSVLLACSLFQAVGSDPSTAPAPALAASPAATSASSLVVMGASASAGFTLSEPFGGPKTAQYRLTRYLEAALVTPGTPIKDLASAPFFLNPSDEGKRQIEEALALKPRAAVAIDFLFWFCYGNVRGEEARVGRFELGLALLDRLKCPVVVGDIPDATAAVGGMLGRGEMPKLETIAAANRRLKEWAATHRNVTVLSLADFMKVCQADEGLKIRGQSWAAGETSKLLQPDKLHPARHGCAALALAVMDLLAGPAAVLAEGDVRWNPEEIYRQATAVPAAAPKATRPTETAPAGGS